MLHKRVDEVYKLVEHLRDAIHALLDRIKMTEVNSHSFQDEVRTSISCLENVLVGTEEVVIRLEESIGHMEENQCSVAQALEPAVHIDCHAGFYVGPGRCSHHVRGGPVAVYRS